MVIPIAIGVRLDVLDIAKVIALGVFFTSPSDTTGSLRLKLQGMLLTILLVSGITFVMHFLKLPLWGLIPIIGFFIFCISYLSIYGFRASLISFSGLFAIVLSFSPFADTDMSIFTQILLIAVGGVWYIALVLLRHVLFPRGATEFYLAETLTLTGDYLEIRAKLVDNKNDRKELIKKLLDCQSDLTENHETLRELLISRRKDSGKSTYQARRLLIFQQLIDMLELAMANPVNYFKTDVIFKENSEQLKDFQDILLAMSNRLKYIAAYLSKPLKIKDSNKVVDRLQQLKKDIEKLEKKTGSRHIENALTLKNYWKYQNNQYDKIAKIERLLRNQSQSIDHRVNNKDLPGFLTRQEYNFNVLVENFNMKSTIFRHSLRIAIVAMIGYGIGLFFQIEKPYWVLLTVIVIMRPNFGLTKSRLRQRSIGTLIGGGIAFAIIMLVRNTTFYGIMAITSFVIGFSMVQRNYKMAATFLTMYILFVYSLLTSEVFEVIQYRVLDTLLGAGLAFAGNLLLWPSWEIKSINKTLKEAIEANNAYLTEIAAFYKSKSEELTDYKIARKKAFLKLSDLSASFQRMTQEPKAQHKNLNEVFQLVMLMHSFLASLASLGTYITHNPTTPASREFKDIVDNIHENLQASIRNLEKIHLKKKSGIHTKTALKKIHKGKIKNAPKAKKFRNYWEYKRTQEEAHLISEQLIWLLSNSERMAKILKQINFK